MLRLFLYLKCFLFTIRIIVLQNKLTNSEFLKNKSKKIVTNSKLKINVPNISKVPINVKQKKILNTLYTTTIPYFCHMY